MHIYKYQLECQRVSLPFALPGGSNSTLCQSLAEFRGLEPRWMGRGRFSWGMILKILTCISDSMILGWVKKDLRGEHQSESS